MPDGAGVDTSFREAVRAATGGRQFVFFIMSYKGGKWPWYEGVKAAVEDQLRIACIRADEVKASGIGILEQVRYLIDHSAAVVAEISTGSPNVFYEAGYAAGIGRPPVLLMERGCTAPVDFRGLELIPYDADTPRGCRDLQEDIVSHLTTRVGSQGDLIRGMLTGAKPQPAYIVTSPLYPPGRADEKARLYASCTFSDYLAVLSLSSAFGSLWGPGQGVELVAAKPAVAELRERPRNLYLIGSPRSNPHTGPALEALQRSARVRWTFDDGDQVPAMGYVPTVLHRTQEGRVERFDPLETVLVGGDPFWVRDHGIIVRGPHPVHDDRVVMILAGAHAVGTAAAAIAATSPAFIREVMAKLPEGTLRDKRAAFWALVEGRCNTCALDPRSAPEGCRLVDEAGVRVLEAGMYEPAAGPVPDSWQTA